MIARITRALARADIFAYACIWLIVLLVVGTLAQRSIGLYLAQQRYFSAWFAMFGPVPLPGGRLTMAVVFISLSAYLLQRKTWSWRRTGLLISHIGALLLLVGGFVTAYFSSEGLMMIREGEATNFVSDDHAMELAVTNHAPVDHDEITAFADRRLAPGAILEDPTLPGRMEVIEYAPSCQPRRRSEAAPADTRGLARDYRLETLPPGAEPEQARACLALRLSGVGDADGRYLLVQDSARQESFRGPAGETFELALRPARTYLPFRIELIDFEKKLHPGTRMAKSYKSTINLIEGDISRRVVIQMNEPLRHRGYTFYQSSFIEGGPRETSILSVVRNRGRLFPYISSLIMCFGLLIHLGMMIWRRPQVAASGGAR